LDLLSQFIGIRIARKRRLRFEPCKGAQRFVSGGHDNLQHLFDGLILNVAARQIPEPDQQRSYSGDAG